MIKINKQEVLDELNSLQERNENIKSKKQKLNSDNEKFKMEQNEFLKKYDKVISGETDNPFVLMEKEQREKEIEEKKGKLALESEEVKKEERDFKDDFYKFSQDLNNRVSSEKQEIREQVEQLKNGLSKQQKIQLTEEKEKLEEQKEKIIKEKEMHLSTIAKWEKNKINSNDVIYRNLKENVIPKKDLEIEEVDNRIGEIDKKFAYNPVEKSADYTELEEIGKVLNNAYPIESKISALKGLFTEKDKEKTEAEVEEEKFEVGLKEGSEAEVSEEKSEVESKEGSEAEVSEEKSEAESERISDVEKQFGMALAKFLEEMREKDGEVIDDVEPLEEKPKSQPEERKFAGMQKTETEQQKPELMDLIKDVQRKVVTPVRMSTSQKKASMDKGNPKAESKKQEDKINEKAYELKNRPATARDDVEIIIGRTAKITVGRKKYRVPKRIMKKAKKLTKEQIMSTIKENTKVESYDYIEKCISMGIIDPVVINAITGQKRKQNFEVRNPLDVYLNACISTLLGQRIENAGSLTYDLKDLSKFGGISIEEKEKVCKRAITLSKMGFGKVTGEYKPSLLSRLSYLVKGKKVPELAEVNDFVTDEEYKAARIANKYISDLQKGKLEKRNDFAKFISVENWEIDKDENGYPKTRDGKIVTKKVESSILKPTPESAELVGKIVNDYKKEHEDKEH